MAIANSAAESASPQKRKANCLEKPMEEEEEKKKMEVDDPQLGLSSGDLKQPEQINFGAPIVGDQGSKVKAGTTCHQCRQKLRVNHFFAECQNIKKGKQCPMKVCGRCLKNRYFEKEEEVTLVDDWICPKCRGICNCSSCMRKRGQKPTGVLSYKAKASGFSSASEMHNVQGPVALTKTASEEKLPASDEDRAVAPLKPKENHLDQTSDTSLEPIEMDNAEKGMKLKTPGYPRKKAKKHSEPKEVEILLPHGTELTNVAEVDFSAEDAGNALQFIQFCSTFGEILNIKKGQAESILYDIMAGRSRPGKSTSLIQFQIQLLKLIKKLGEESPLSPTDGKNGWLHVLKEYIFESVWVPKELSALCLETNDGYCSLGSSEKLRLLVFLCDETLKTKPLRTWIKEATDKLLAPKEKDEVVKAPIGEDGASLSITEHEAVASERKAESERVHAEILETTALLAKYTMRTEPVFIDAKGRVFWSLKGFNKSDLLLQDMVSSYSEMPNEKWYTFNHEEVKAIHEHIALSRVKRHRRRKTLAAAPATHMANGNVNPENDMNGILHPNLSNAGEGCGEANGDL